MAEEPGTPDSTQASDETLSAAANRATIASARVARWSAIIAAVAVVVAAGSAFYSSYLAQQQNNSTQRQELVSLIGDIAQGQQASSTTNGNAQLLVLGEAEEANKIIEDLSGVSQDEKYLVGAGLQYGQDYQDAQNLFTEAADENTVPRVTADSWRGAAAALYALDSAQEAENDIKAAEKANGSSASLAYTYLFDIPYRTAISDCLTASSEWRKAALLTQEQHNVLTGGNAVITEGNAKDALIHACKIKPAALEKIYISSSSSTQT